MVFGTEETGLDWLVFGSATWVSVADTYDSRVVAVALALP